ncbi:MAG: zinc-binding alcohol dehydrogenase [Hyphomicrobiaceae bacterium]|nr:zinc-binding alcohol dehydrogenase [Hyphomicrobiaceae bacterium]
MTTPAAGDSYSARALWYVAEGKAELRSEPLSGPSHGEVLVRALYSAISRGTERLIMSGAVPRGEWDRMRAPLQAGAFPFPVKYGYCAAGIVEAGPDELRGRTVFVLHPHQDVFVVPIHMAVPVPDEVPARRATLAANMETALNALWDAGAGPADRIVVVGGGVVGVLAAYLAARLPGADVTLVDVLPERARIADRLGFRFALPDAAPREADVVLHTSATAPGLAAAIAAAGLEATVVELSWYGEGAVPAPLGGAFHSRRLRLVSSQVGQVAPSRRPRWSQRRRLEAALSLLHDPRLDALVSEEIELDDAPARLPEVLAPGAPGLAPVIRYPAVTLRA